MILNERQISIIQRLADGEVPKEIRRELGINEHVYKDQIDYARQRLHALTTHHAIAIAIRQGLIA